MKFFKWIFLSKFILFSWYIIVLSTTIFPLINCKGNFKKNLNTNLVTQINLNKNSNVDNASHLNPFYNITQKDNILKNQIKYSLEDYKSICIKILCIVGLIGLMIFLIASFKREKALNLL
jgi:hypothetical protein